MAVSDQSVALRPAPSTYPSAAYAYALSAAPTLAHSLVLSRLSSSPTLLPQNLASLITALSLCARVSIRASALFIEAILESAKYSTATGLGLTRRALISAVGSARALHYVNQKLDWSGKDENEVKSRSVESRVRGSRDDDQLMPCLFQRCVPPGA